MNEDYEYLTVKQIVHNKKYPFTLGQIRAFLMSKEKNGLNQSVAKIGKRLYLRTDLFEKWMDNHLNQGEK